MLPWVEGSLVLAGLAAAAFIWIRVRGYRSVASYDESVSEQFSLARYEPMKRLLLEDDLEFLAGRPGVRPETVSRLRKQRQKVFRTYLHELAADFRRLHEQARLLVADAPAEYEHLVGVLVEQQFRFRMALIGVEFRLVLHQMGIGQVDVSGLLAPIQKLWAELPMPPEEAGFEMA
jgi:hypothetical protein